MSSFPLRLPTVFALTQIVFQETRTGKEITQETGLVFKEAQPQKPQEQQSQNWK
jgi:hypothetical protein